MKNYPLHETTVLENFRNMMELSASKFYGKTAYSYKDNPNSDKVVKITFETTP